ncbi:c-type cytochrome [Olivibacter domesticus]|uniref:Cytochrome c n=1 Tax=Olivibacter domesticus TaxID=407022 RepID=A0A1H7QLG2_OLID1|nr:cytochrome c [Olivibacter domesticus]SEL48746.1 Cytochrome c [Olivibacter domesticus]
MNIIMRIQIAVLAAVLTITYACGGNSSSDGEIQTSANAGRKNTSVQREKVEVSPKDLSAKGVGPITEYKPEAISKVLVKQGKDLFMAKCAMCHKMDQKTLGPPLRGITGRHTPEWVLNMLLAPEKMIEKDPAAKKLYAIYNTPMINQQLSEKEAKAIYDYLRSE